MRKIVLVTALAFVLVACGGGSNGSSGSDSSSTSSSSTTTTTNELPKDPQDQAIVKAGVLKLSDLPAGWSEEPDDGDDSNPDLEAQFEQIPDCAALKAATEDRDLGEAKSPDFAAAEDAETSNDAEIYVDAAEVDEIMAVIPSEQSVSCIHQALELGVNEGLEADPETAAVLRGVTVTGGALPPAAYGDGTAGVGFQVTVDVGQVFTLYFELLAVKVGRTLTTFSFQDSQPNPLAALRPVIIPPVVDRLRAAGA